MLRRISAASALAVASWAVLVWLSGGLRFSVGSIQLSSSDPLRPAVVAALFAACYAVMSGTVQLRHDVEALRRRLTPTRAAALLMVVTTVVGLTHNSWAVGASDTYSYVSQADLWLEGRLKVEVPLARQVPWPGALATFTPLGYGAVANESAIAPITGPGLPLMMAAFKRVAGHPAAFLVAPLTGALLLWATFLIGRRLGSETVGLGGAWLVATSPTFLMLFKSPMSDVPASAFWALATYWTLSASSKSALAAGVAASAAILIRPNLVPLAAVLAIWLIGSARWRRVANFALGALPGCMIVALINNYLYGSPLSSGYGDLGEIFSIANVPTALGRYGSWLIETQTPVVVAGLAGLAIAPVCLWRTREARASVRLLASLTLAVWVLYSVYPPFDAWWFLRFLLPTWPAMCLGTVALLLWGSDRRRSWSRAVQFGAVVALGLFALATAWQRDVFPAGEGERRYATIAKLVEAHTAPDAMILTSIHSGATRYYAGRATMRFDLLHEEWLDRSVEWLRQQGRHPYLLVEDWEIPAFTKRFGGTSRMGTLALAPLLTYQAYQIPGRVYLFDLLRPTGPTFEPLPIQDPRPLCVAPAGPAPL